jgi:hypothetical protein
VYSVHCLLHIVPVQIYLQRRMRIGVNFDQRSIETWTSQKRQWTSNIVYLYPTSPYLSCRYLVLPCMYKVMVVVDWIVLWHIQYCSTFHVCPRICMIFKQNIHIQMHEQTWYHPPMTFISMHSWRTFKFKCMWTNSRACDRILEHAIEFASMQSNAFEPAWRLLLWNKDY